MAVGGGEPFIHVGIYASIIAYKELHVKDIIQSINLPKIRVVLSLQKLILIPFLLNKTLLTPPL